MEQKTTRNLKQNNMLLTVYDPNQNQIFLKKLNIIPPNSKANLKDIFPQKWYIIQGFCVHVTLNNIVLHFYFAHYLFGYFVPT